MTPARRIMRGFHRLGLAVVAICGGFAAVLLVLAWISPYPPGTHPTSDLRFAYATLWLAGGAVGYAVALGVGWIAAGFARDE